MSRLTVCKYSRIGCPWRGPVHESSAHENECPHPNKSGADVMGALMVIDQKNEEEKQFYDAIFELLSYEKITFNGNYISTSPSRSLNKFTVVQIKFWLLLEFQNHSNSRKH